MIINSTANSDFRKFARSGGVSMSALDSYARMASTRMNPTAYVNPNVIEETTAHSTTIDVFSRLMRDRIIFLGDEIDPMVSSIIVSQLLYLSSQDTEGDISIYINSPGGSVYDGLAIYDTMQYIDNKVSTICVGMAASMASVLLCAGEKGERSALPHSRVLIHQPLGGAHGQCSDIQIEAAEIQKLKDELYDIISRHTGQPTERIYKDADRDYWLRSNEALEYGIIDKILK